MKFFVSSALESFCCVFVAFVCICPCPFLAPVLVGWGGSGRNKNLAEIAKFVAIEDIEAVIS